MYRRRLRKQNRVIRGVPWYSVVSSCRNHKEILSVVVPTPMFFGDLGSIKASTVLESIVLAQRIQGTSGAMCGISYSYRFRV